jgi:NADPH:quinone reductase-like Zn-dependent oxidoreductase
MRQIWISKSGPPEVLVVRETPDPQPASGEMRIRVEASGVNFADVMGRMGLYPDLPPIPVVPGYEVAERVDAVGDEVDPSWVGRDVFALTRFGGYTEVVCVPHAQVFPRPQGMSAEEGATIPGKLSHRLATHDRNGRIEAKRNGPHSFRWRRRQHRRDPDRQANRSEGHRNRVGRQARRTAHARRRSRDRLPDRGS